MPESTHTPTPWTWNDDDSGRHRSLDGHLWMQEDGLPGEHHVLTCSVCSACRERGAKCLCPTDANAALIVEAVNSHANLLAEVARLTAELERLHFHYGPPGSPCPWKDTGALVAENAELREKLAAVEELASRWDAQSKADGQFGDTHSSFLLAALHPKGATET